MQEKQFIEHLEDLRGCVLKSLIGVAGGVVVAFISVSYIFRFISEPYRACLIKLGLPVDIALRSLGPADTLHITLKAALVFGLGLSSPWIVYQIWGFISPALHKNEKKYTAIFCLLSTVFFLSGVLFAYFLVLPTALSFFYTYTRGLGIVPDWAIANYYNFVISFLVGFGLVFELPMAITILTIFGITTPKGLVMYRKHAIVGIFIVAGIFTPGPDVVSQMMMALPMFLLYELSIVAAKVITKRSEVSAVTQSQL